MGYRLYNLSLWSKVAIIISLGFATLCIAFFLLGEQALKDSTDRIRNERLVIAQMAAGEIDDVFQRAVGELKQAGHFIKPDTLNPSYSHEIGHFDLGVTLLDPAGYVVTCFPINLCQSGADLSKLPDVAQALKRRDVTISDPAIEPHHSRPAIAISVPTFEEDRFTGLLRGLIDLDGPAILTPLQRAAQLDQSGHAVLVDRSGRVLASTLHLPFLTHGEHFEFYRQAMADGKPTTGTIPFELQNISGETFGELHLMAFVPLEKLPLAVAAGGDEDVAFAGVRRLRFGLAVLSIVALILAWAATLIGTRWLVQPIHRLTEAARRIADGHLDTPLQIKVSGAIGVLGVALEQVRQQLLSNITELAALNKTLENQMAEQAETLRHQESTLTSMDETIRTPLALKEMLAKILNQTCAASRVEHGVLFLYDEDRTTLQEVIIQNTKPQWLEVLKTLANQAAVERKPTSVTKLPVPLEPPETGGQAVSALAIPLVLDEDILGAIVLADSHQQTFSPQQLTLLATIASQTALIVRNDQLYARLEQQAIIEERSRLAREIHDGLVQTLGFLKMQLNRMQHWAQTDNFTRLTKEISNLNVIVEEAYGEARDAITGLSVGLNADDSLEDILTEHVQSFSARYGLQIKLTVTGSRNRLQPPAILHLFRLAQEGLTNIRKHAQTRQAWIDLDYQPDQLALTISDDGKGFDVQLLQETSYRGLQVMHERAKSLGGQLSISARLPQGTTISITVPNPYLEKYGRNNLDSSMTTQIADPPAKNRIQQKDTL